MLLFENRVVRILAFTRVYKYNGMGTAGLWGLRKSSYYNTSRILQVRYPIYNRPTAGRDVPFKIVFQKNNYKCIFL